MTWKTWAGSALITSSFLLINTALASNLVVFDAKGAGLKAGQVVDSALPLKLADGESAALIADTGRIIHLKGPYNAAPLAEGGGNVGSVKDAMASLINAGTKDNNALGATRSADAAFNMAKQGKKLPNPWVIDVTEGANQCYREGEPVVFWRPESKANTTIRVALGKDTWKARTDWPKGKSDLLLPADAPVKDGVNMTLEMDGKKTESVLHLIPGALQSDPAKAAWMHEKGCKHQFMALLGTINK